MLLERRRINPTEFRNPPHPALTVGPRRSDWSLQTAPRATNQFEEYHFSLDNLPSPTLSNSNIDILFLDSDPQNPIVDLTHSLRNQIGSNPRN